MKATFSAVASLALPLDDHASKTYLHALIEHSPIAIVVLDSCHRFKMCNPAFEALFQFEAAELAIWGIDTMIAGPDFIQEAAQLTRRVLAAERVHTLTKRRRKDGLIIDVELHGVPLIIDGRVQGIYGLYQDVTERSALNAAMEQMSTRLNEVRDEERRRFARDLHDSLSQELTLLTWNLRKLSRGVADDPALQRLVAETSELADLCVDQIRSASFLMHPPQLGEANLHTAILWLAEGFQRRSGIATALEMKPLPARLSPDLELALYRIVQEGFANVLRHARESSILLSLTHQDGMLTLTMANHVQGQRGKQVARSSLTGVGLRSMSERLEPFGGVLQISSSHAGTELTASIPLSEERLCAS